MSAPHRSLVLILIAFTLLSLAFNTLTPLGEAPDEVSHFSYVRHLAATWRLPEPQGTVFGEVFQPPLYYVLAAPLTTWLAPGPLPVEANSDWLLGDPYRGFNVLIHPAAARWPWRGEALAWHLARLPSTVFGLVTLLATAGIARRTFPDHPWVAVAATAFVGFLPQFAFLSGAVSNDVLATALGALLLWQLARIVTNPQAAGSRGQWALVGALGGLGIWTKASGWTFAATALAAVLLATRGKPAQSVGPRGQLQNWSRALIPLAGAWALVAAPWLIWNWYAYGDPLGWSLMRQVTDARTTPLGLDEVRGLAVGAYRSFWAGFGGAAHRHFPPVVQLATAVFLLASGAGLVRVWRQRCTLSPATRQLLLLWALHSVVVLAAWLQWSRTVLGTGQGRLLFPALPALAVLVAGGWVGLWSRRGGYPRAAAWVLAGSLVGLSLAALLWVLRPLASPPLSPVHGDASAAGWHFGPALVLDGFAFPWTVDSHVPPGSTAELYLAWSAPARPPDLRLRLRLIDREGQPVWFKDGTPSAGRDTSDEWRPGTTGLPSWHRVTIPPGTPPGWYRLMLSIHPAGDPEPLPVTDAAGAELGDEIMIGQVTVTTETTQ